MEKDKIIRFSMFFILGLIVVVILSILTLGVENTYVSYFISNDGSQLGDENFTWEYTDQILNINGIINVSGTNNTIFIDNSEVCTENNNLCASTGGNVSQNTTGDVNISGVLYVDESLKRVGVNNPNPRDTIDIMGNIIINGSSVVEFGEGITKEPNAGKIGYQLFSTALDIVGAGTTNANRKVKIFAEGGLDLASAPLVSIANIDFNDVTGNKLLFFSTSFGIGLNPSELTNFVGGGSDFSWRTDSLGGTEIMELDTATGNLNLSTGNIIVNDLSGSYVNNSAYVCVDNNGILFTNETRCP